MSHQRDLQEEIRKADDKLAEVSARLISYEARWRDRQKFLEQKGYMLRRRLRPEWVPSWQGNNSLVLFAEDSIQLPASQPALHYYMISQPFLP